MASTGTRHLVVSDALTHLQIRQTPSTASKFEQLPRLAHTSSRRIILYRLKGALRHHYNNVFHTFVEVNLRRGEILTCHTSLAVGFHGHDASDAGNSWH